MRFFIFAWSNWNGAIDKSPTTEVKLNLGPNT
jgi:hypothetical protein